MLRAVERLRALGVDGVLIIAPQVASMGALWDLPADLPIVAVEAGPQEGVPVAEVDQYQGARLATEHLLELGHPTVHHLAGPTDWSEAQQRIEGWRDALDAAGARGRRAAARGLVAALGLRARPPAARAARRDRDLRRQRPDGARACCARCTSSGRDVPGDVSIVGFDDIPESEFFTPPLTTVRQDFNEMGRRSLHLLLEEIESGSRSNARATVPASLVVRASTAAPRA